MPRSAARRARRPLALVAAATAALALPSAASAAPRLQVDGAGFGHGVGMSQYGALGLAEQGRDYRDILGHYYSGTALGRLDARSVRVLLRSGPRVSVSRAGAIGGRRVSPRRTYTVSSGRSGRLEVRDGRRLVGTSAGALRATGRGIVLRGTAANGVRNGAYRGSLEIRPGASGLLAVNALGLEDYVRGVVPGEVPASWAGQALRAQAVAARTYAITTSAGGSAFDQYADTRSQVYRGISAEHPRTDDAVAATRGEVVTYRGTPVTTFFFSTSGGRTEAVENSFLGSSPRPWLRSVSDPADRVSPRHRWRLTFSLTAAQRRLRGLVRGKLRSIRVLRRGDSPRVISAEVVGSRGVVRTTGPKLRARLGLYDTWATFRVVGAKRQPRPEPAPAPAPTSGSTGGFSGDLRAPLGRISP